MVTDEGGSVTGWILDLRGGDPEAARALWDRYFDDLVRLARAKLRATRRRGADEDEEDAALGAFDSFCAGLARGNFPDLVDRSDLWRLLVVLTARKAWAQAQRRGRRKRGGLARFEGEAADDGPSTASPRPTPRPSSPRWSPRSIISGSKPSATTTSAGSPPGRSRGTPSRRSPASSAVPGRFAASAA